MPCVLSCVGWVAATKAPSARGDGMCWPCPRSPRTWPPRPRNSRTAVPASWRPRSCVWPSTPWARSRASTAATTCWARSSARSASANRRGSPDGQGYLLGLPVAVAMLDRAGGSMHALFAGLVALQWWRRPGDVQQGHGVAVFQADGGHLVPAEERDLVHPFGVRAELLHVEAVVIGADPAPDVAHLAVVLAVDMHADDGGRLPGCLDHLAHVVQGERGPRLGLQVFPCQRAAEETMVVVRRLELGHVAMAHHVHAVVGHAVAHHPEQEELPAHATNVATKAALLQFGTP